MAVCAMPKPNLYNHKGGVMAWRSTHHLVRSFPTAVLAMIFTMGYLGCWWLKLELFLPKYAAIFIGVEAIFC
jgi:transposase